MTENKFPKFKDSTDSYWAPMLYKMFFFLIKYPRPETEVVAVI